MFFSLHIVISWMSYNKFYTEINSTAYCPHPPSSIWVNYNISLTWIKAIWGWFPLLTMIPVRSQWGRYNLPRSIQPPIPIPPHASSCFTAMALCFRSATAIARLSRVELLGRKRRAEAPSRWGWEKTGELGIFFREMRWEKDYPLVNIEKNYWTWPFIVSFPIKHGDFP